MKKLTAFPGKWAVVAICTAVGGVAVGAGGMEVAKQYFVQGQSATQIIVLPGGNADNNGNIARLDTSTGAVYRFRGNIDNPSVRNTWELRVAAVKGETSGLLEIQRLAFGSTQVTFLVDVVTGNTWILRNRASTNGSWDPVPVFKQSNWGN